MSLRLLIAPDSFKGSLTSIEAAEIISCAARDVFTDVSIATIPIADGGEGTIDAFACSCGGTFCSARVSAPMGDKVDAKYAVLSDGTAVIEMAQASGLYLVEGEKDPLVASSAGTGELICDALSGGARSFIVGLGGSATNDGGLGMLRALGARFSDDAGNDVDRAGDMGRIRHIDLSGMNPLLKQAKFTVTCDVTNPLLGDSGATAVYGRQKGVTNETAPILEAGLANLYGLARDNLGLDVIDLPGSGAAGGMGAALTAFLGAKLERGIDVILQAAGFDEKLEQSDIVITGEGSIDGQSVLYGKVITGIQSRCAKRNVPVIAICGQMGSGAEIFCDNPGCTIATCVNAIMSSSQAMSEAKPLLYQTSKRTFIAVKIGLDLRAK